MTVMYLHTVLLSARLYKLIHGWRGFALMFNYNYLNIPMKIREISGYSS